MCVFTASASIIYLTHDYRLLNTHEAALVDFPLEDRQVSVHGWRGPMVSATGSFCAAHQDPNGIGNSIYCAAGHVVFFIPLLQDNQQVIVDFSDVNEDVTLGFEYLFVKPHRFTSFILSPGQTV